MAPCHSKVHSRAGESRPFNRMHLGDCNSPGNLRGVYEVSPESAERGAALKIQKLFFIFLNFSYLKVTFEISFKNPKLSLSFPKPAPKELTKNEPDLKQQNFQPKFLPLFQTWHTQS